MTIEAENPEADGKDKKPSKRVVREFLIADRTPMWFTLVALLFGAGGTYYLAPSVNAQFEAQKIKSDFVIRNYGDLRAKMEDFQGLYTVVTQKMVAGDDVRADILKLQELRGRISAQTVSLLPMFTHADGPQAAAEVNNGLNGMMTVLFTNAGKKLDDDVESAAFTEQVAQATRKLVPPLLKLYVRIAEVGRLNPTREDTDLPQR